MFLLQIKSAQKILGNHRWRIQGLPRCASHRVAHQEGQNEEENEESFRKNKNKLSKFEEKMKKVEILPNQDCEAGYNPGNQAAFKRNLALQGN